jgi:hypothetical protein
MHMALDPSEPFLLQQDIDRTFQTWLFLQLVTMKEEEEEEEEVLIAEFPFFSCSVILFLGKTPPTVCFVRRCIDLFYSHLMTISVERCTTKVRGERERERVVQFNVYRRRRRKREQ